MEALRPLDKDKRPSVAFGGNSRYAPRGAQGVTKEMSERMLEERTAALGGVRYLDRFNDGEEENRRPAPIAFIPAATG